MHILYRLAKLGLLPTFFGQSINGVVKQKYHGDVTMVPKFTPMESIGLKVYTCICASAKCCRIGCWFYA